MDQNKFRMFISYIAPKAVVFPKEKKKWICKLKSPMELTQWLITSHIKDKQFIFWILKQSDVFKPKMIQDKSNQDSSNAAFCVM